MNKTLKFYISQLSPKRAIMYSDSWWTVGCTIYNCTEGSVGGYIIWHDFSKQDKNYNNDVCDKKWGSFKKYVRFYSIRKLVPMVYEDGGTTYNPDSSQIIEDENVRNFVFNILVPKLSIRRTRNIKTLGNLCSAMYTMSEGKDREAMLNVSKRIKDSHLKSYFVSSWDHKVFRFTCDINSIISWHNSDEKEKPNPRATNIKSYFDNDPLWLSNTTLYLKSFDDAGHKPRYFKTTAKERKELKAVVENRSYLNRLLNAGHFEAAELIIKKTKHSKK